ncbi:hypothetical protein [Sphingomonas sp. NFX23]|uniref:hypothetical protein n=1 Tax=Sphingomonas sp. NFX23 TaxID=2819532 RepID=UPI003CED7509
MTVDQNTRLECLRMASDIGGDEATVLANARSFEAYVAAGTDGSVNTSAAIDQVPVLRPLSRQQQDAWRELQGVRPNKSMPVSHALKLAHALGDATLAELQHSDLMTGA